jgi:hypothetical protein
VNFIPIVSVLIELLAETVVSMHFSSSAPSEMPVTRTTVSNYWRRDQQATTVCNHSMQGCIHKADYAQTCLIAAKALSCQMAVPNHDCHCGLVHEARNC